MNVCSTAGDCIAIGRSPTSKRPPTGRTSPAGTIQPHDQAARTDSPTDPVEGDSLQLCFAIKKNDGTPPAVIRSKNVAYLECTRKE